MSGSIQCRPPAQVGQIVSDIETPALLLDMDRFERNMENLVDIVKKQYPGINIRPHAKAHKCPVIAGLQQKSGCRGVCCQKLSEAEAMVQGGIQDILISNQVVGRSKIQRLVSLSQICNQLSICVDNDSNIKEISEACRQRNTNIGLLVEMNVNQNRCGVDSGEEVVRLAQLINKLDGVRFIGIQCYNGINQHIRKTSEREAAVNEVVRITKEVLQCLETAGIECPTVTGGGTGTFRYEASSGVFTEIQPGSYIFMDADYSRNLRDDGEYDMETFTQSLYVLATVHSLHANRAVIDTGLKALSMDSGPPTVCNVRDQCNKTYICGGDEHGIIVPPTGLAFGDKVWLVPGHCDPTVNMYDWIVGVRNHKVEHVWPISARGPGI